MWHPSSFFLLSSVVLLGCASHLVFYNVYNPYVTRMSPYIIGIIPHIMHIYICILVGVSHPFTKRDFPPICSSKCFFFQADPLATEVVVERSSRAQGIFPAVLHGGISQLATVDCRRVIKSLLVGKHGHPWTDYDDPLWLLCSITGYHHQPTGNWYIHSGYVKIAIENGHRNSGLSHW